MSVIAPVVDRLERKLHPTAGWDRLDKQFGRKLTDAERSHYLRHGRLPRRPMQNVKIAEPSPVMQGRLGVSDEAVHLFERARDAGGTLTLSEDIRFAGTRTRMDDLQRLVDELVHFGLVARVGRAAIGVAPEHMETALWSNDWSRWSGSNTLAVRRTGTR